MKRVSRIAAVSLLSVLIAGGATTPKLNAQNGEGEIFTVPFAFTADGHEIQAGTYEVRRDASAFLISIQNVETGEKELFAVRPEQNGTAVPAKGILVFERCGHERELIEFHVRGTNLYSTPTRLGRRTNSELQSCSRPDTVTLAAR